MSDIPDNLNMRFNVVLQSATEREFYQNLYHYFDFIYKTPHLKSIFDESSHEYSKRHYELWKKRPMTDEEADLAEAETIKLERFNLFAVGAFIDGRIYLPIADYRETTEPDAEQDPAAVILLRGLEYATSLNRWNKDTLKLLDRWYNGKRSFYESKLRRFHIIFLDELEKTKFASKKKIEIAFDKEASVLTLDGKRVNIKLKNDKPIEHYILEFIFDNKEGLNAKSYYSEILENKFPEEGKTERSLRRACEALNKKVSEQAEISNFLLFETGKSGSVQINPEYL